MGKTHYESKKEKEGKVPRKVLQQDRNRKESKHKQRTWESDE